MGSEVKAKDWIKDFTVTVQNKELKKLLESLTTFEKKSLHQSAQRAYKAVLNNKGNSKDYTGMETTVKGVKLFLVPDPEEGRVYIYYLDQFMAELKEMFEKIGGYKWKN